MKMENQENFSSSGRAVTEIFFSRSESERWRRGLIALEFLTIGVFAGDIVPLDDDRADLARIHRGYKITIAKFVLGGLRFIEEIEQQDHHKTDDKPEREIFVKLVQCYPHKVAQRQYLADRALF